VCVCVFISHWISLTLWLKHCTLLFWKDDGSLFLMIWHRVISTLSQHNDDATLSLTTCSPWKCLKYIPGPPLCLHWCAGWRLQVRVTPVDGVLMAVRQELCSGVVLEWLQLKPIKHVFILNVSCFDLCVNSGPQWTGEGHGALRQVVGGSTPGSTRPCVLDHTEPKLLLWLCLRSSGLPTGPSVQPEGRSDDADAALHSGEDVTALGCHTHSLKT